MKRLGSEASEEKEFSLQGISIARMQSLLDLADAKSITAAANRRNTDTSHLSRQIGELEEFIGCKLRQKASKTAKLSPEGEELAMLFRQHFNALKGFRDRSRRFLDSASIAAGDSILHAILLPKLSLIQHPFERTRLAVSALPTFEIIQALQNFSLDLGLLREDAISKNLPADAKDESLSCRRLGTYRYAVFVSRGLLKRVDDVEARVFQLPFATIRHHWDTNFVEAAKKNGIEIANLRVWCENFTQVFQLVHVEQYAGILPIFCAPLLPQSKFVSIEPQFLKAQSQSVVLAWNQNILKIRESTLAPFIEHVAATLQF